MGPPVTRGACSLAASAPTARTVRIPSGTVRLRFIGTPSSDLRQRSRDGTDILRAGSQTYSRTPVRSSEGRRDGRACGQAYGKHLRGVRLQPDRDNDHQPERPETETAEKPYRRFRLPASLGNGEARRPPRYLSALVGVFPAKDVASARQPRWMPDVPSMRLLQLRLARAERCLTDERSHARAWLAKAESDRLAVRFRP